MTKRIILDIQYCNSCPNYSGTQGVWGGEIKPKCNLHDAYFESTTSYLKKIPDWCPLDDAPEEKQDG